MITYDEIKEEIDELLWDDVDIIKDGTAYMYIEYQDDIAWVNIHEIVEQVDAHDITYILERKTSTNPNGGSISSQHINTVAWHCGSPVLTQLNVQAYQCTEYMELLKEYPDAPAEWLNALANIR